MAKQLFFTSEEIETFIQEAQVKLIDQIKALKKRKYEKNDGEKITIDFSVKNITNDRKAMLVFSPKSWIKMYGLINGYTTEVEWHGLVSRLDETTFFVDDILIFPHEVTGVTVTSNQKEYEEWLDTLDTSTFNKLRLHGHSHVNMCVTPSSTDMNYRKNIIDNFGLPTEDSDFFYIFFIGNKRGEANIEIYDLQNNILYESSDVIVEVPFGKEETLKNFLDEAKKVVKPPKPKVVDKEPPATFAYPYLYPYPYSQSGMNDDASRYKKKSRTEIKVEAFPRYKMKEFISRIKISR